jgi:SPP1 family predicted phage head-tail adaptor
MLNSGLLNRRITVEKATVTRSASTGAEVKTWATLGGEVWAQVIESATASDEKLQNGVATYSRPTRVRIRYRSDINNTMRLNLGGSRLLEIVGVAVMDRDRGMELACREWSHE